MVRDQGEEGNGESVGKSEVAPRIDLAEVERAVSVLIDERHTVELRCLTQDWKTSDSTILKGGNLAGIQSTVEKFSDRHIFLIRNPVSLKCGSTPAKKEDVVSRRWLVIDVDPERPSNTMATAEQREAAIAVANDVAGWLTGRGWPPPVVTDSGNGTYLEYRVELPLDGDSDDLVTRLLDGLDDKFSTKTVKVDGSGKKAAQPFRLPGTVNRKGDDPGLWRVCRLVSAPEEVAVVKREMIVNAAALLPVRAGRAAEEWVPPGGLLQTDGNRPGDDYNRRGGLIGLLRKHGWTVLGIRDDYAQLGRPGKGNGGLSATLGYCKSKAGGYNLFHVFSTNAHPFEADKSYSPFSVYAMLECDGDYKEAAKRLAAEGYGEQGKKPARPTLLPIQSKTGEKAGVVSVVSAVGKKGKPYKRLSPYQPFPTKTLPIKIKELVEEAAQEIDADSALVALPAMAAVAGAIGNTRALRVRRKWSEPCAVWCATVAESGERKGPGYSISIDPILDAQMDLYDAHGEAVQKYNNDLTAWKEVPKDDREGEKPERPEEPPTFITGDATIEALGEILRDNPRGVLVARDELDGWFQSFTRYKGKGGGSDRSQWLELHKAGTLLVERLTRERGRLAVRRALVSVVGTIQPGTLARALDADALQSGLGARILMAMPPRKRRVWREDDDIDSGVSAGYENLLKNLLKLTISDLKKRRPFELTLSEPARRMWIDFYNEWGEAQFNSEGAQAAAFAKIEGYALRLALIHHVVSHVAVGMDDRRPVGTASMSAGITLARWFAAEAVRIYAALQEDEESQSAGRLVAWITSQGGKTTARNLQRANGYKYPSRDAAEAALQSLVDAHLADWHQAETGPQGGQPARWLILRPTPDTTDTTADLEGDPSSDTTSDTTATTPDFQPENKGSVGSVGRRMSDSDASRGEGGREVVSEVVSEEAQPGVRFEYHGAAVITQCCAVDGLIDTEVVSVKVTIGKSAQYSACASTYFVRKPEKRRLRNRGRSGFYTTHPDNIRYLIVTINGETRYDSRQDVPCDMTKWQETRARMQAGKEHLRKMQGEPEPGWRVVDLQ